jgi:hypothetical protein
MSQGSAEKIACTRESCINYKEGYCSLRNPERNIDYCLYYEDALDSLRLNVNKF